MILAQPLADNKWWLEMLICVAIAVVILVVLWPLWDRR